MDLFSKIPFLKSDQTEEQSELSPEEAKKQRIQFHRDHVRNGPSNFKTVTNGQQKRAHVRALNRRTRKARRAQVRQHFSNMAEASVLRGHLQATGIAPYALASTKIDPQRALGSVIWIVQRFADDGLVNDDGQVEVTEAVVRQSLTSCLNRWQHLVGLPPTELSPAYVLPVALPA